MHATSGTARETAPAPGFTRAEAPAAGSPGTNTPDTGTYVTFDLAAQTFGVAVTSVREILDQQEICRLPNSRADCAGVIDTRGESIPVIDLASRLGLARSPIGPDSRIIVFEIEQDGGHHPIGVQADRVLDVTQIPASTIEPAPVTALPQGGIRSLCGIARLDGKLVVLLDLGGVFGPAGPNPT